MKIKKLGFLLMLVCFIFSSLGIQAYAAEVGDQLPGPESGWRRYNDTYEFIHYDSSFSYLSGITGYYGGDRHITYAIDGTVTIKFYGTKFRLIGATANVYSEIEVILDGVNVGTFDRIGKNDNFNILNYEYTGLNLGIHEIKFINKSSKGGLVVDTIDIDDNGELKPYNEVTEGFVLNIEPEKETIKQSETVSANLVIDNINEIVAEDIRINYDDEKLEFLGFEEVDGMKLIKAVEKTADGDLRVIVASEGESNIINAKEVLLKLKFKGVGTGEALVDITNGRVTDGIELEKDLVEEECGEATIVIEGLKDVNNSGEFTLLDLGIDARHFSKDPASSELDEYNTDIVVNGEIDDEDLLEIGRLILENPNYTPNN